MAGIGLEKKSPVEYSSGAVMFNVLSIRTMLTWEHAPCHAPESGDVSAIAPTCLRDVQRGVGGAKELFTKFVAIRRDRGQRGVIE
jgi:hypothetical protein